MHAVVAQRDAALARAPLPAQGALDSSEGLMGLTPYEFTVCGKSLRWYLKRDVDAILSAAPAQAGDALDERDMMLWLSDDPEVFANGPDDFANDYAANCLSVGDDVEVDVDCTYRAPKRALRIALIPKGDDDDCEVVWKWVERAAMSASQGTTREAE